MPGVSVARSGEDGDEAVGTVLPPVLETPEERKAAAEERAALHRAAAEECARLAAVAESALDRERWKRLADRHAVSALFHERAAQFQADAIIRAETIGSLASTRRRSGGFRGSRGR